MFTSRAALDLLAACLPSLSLGPPLLALILHRLSRFFFDLFIFELSKFLIYHISPVWYISYILLSSVPNNLTKLTFYIFNFCLCRVFQQSLTNIIISFLFTSVGSPEYKYLSIDTQIDSMEVFIYFQRFP